MKLNNFRTIGVFFTTGILICQVPFGYAEENIIQEEKMSFEKCLKVITESEDKLSIFPEIIDLNDQKRTATFSLSDGTLKITCDGNKTLLTVSTKMN